MAISDSHNHIGISGNRFDGGGQKLSGLRICSTNLGSKNIIKNFNTVTDMTDTFICAKVKWMEKKKKMSFNDILVPYSITIKAKKKSFSGVWIVVNGIRLDWTSKLYNLIT